jgi:DNA-binding SARP family transcriptional activator
MSSNTPPGELDHNGVLQVKVLGSVALFVHDRPVRLTPVEKNLLGLLVAAGPDGLPTDRLADQLWPYELPQTWRASFRNYISRLNKKVAKAHPDGFRPISEGNDDRQLLVGPEHVDLWHLRPLARQPEGVAVELLESTPSLLSGTPFPDLEHTSLIHATVQEVNALRRDILIELATSSEPLSNVLLASVRALCMDDPYNQALLAAVVEVHLTAGAASETISLLDAVEAEEADLGERLRALRTDLRQRGPTGQAAPPTPRPTTTRQAPVLTQLADGPLAGREAVFDELIGVTERPASGVLIHGEGGIGKTRLAAEVAQRLGEQGHHTAYVVADRRIFGSLQPFLDAFPPLAEPIDPYLDDLTDQNAQARCRRKILDYLAETYRGHPLCLVVDDVHWLDDQSSALLMSLARANLPDGLVVIAVGRSGDPDARWTGWLNDLGRAGLQQFKIRPLDRADMVTMIHEVHGPMEAVAADRLAGQLIDLSSGIPGVARWLLDRFDPATLEISIDDLEGTGYVAVVNALSDELCRSGAVASVLGREFNLDDLSRLLADDGVDPELTTDHLDELLAQGLITETPVAGTYQFAHVLAAEAFEASLTPLKRIHYHTAAFKLTDDPIRRARHALVAEPAIGETVAAHALAAAARPLFANGNYSDAITNFAHAERLDPDAVTIDDQLAFLEARERSGLRVGTERAALVTEAVRAGDMSLALRIATVGLPDTEAFEGDLRRVQDLESIDIDKLTVDEQVRYQMQMCRQLVLLGHTAKATEHANRASTIAATPDQRAEAWLAQRLAQGVGLPGRPTDNPPDIEEIEAQRLQLRVGQLQVIDAIATGGSSRSWTTINDHADRTADDAYPSLAWFANLFVTTALTDQGRLDEAKRRATAAHRFGLQAGLRIAEGTVQTQLFVWELISGTHGSIFPHVDQLRRAITPTNVIFEAAVVASQAAYTNMDLSTDALRRLRSVCERAGQSHFDFAAVAIMADAIAATGDRNLMEWASELLTPVADHYVLVASAAANLGPGQRILAKLEPDLDGASTLLDQARIRADQDGLPLWQVVTRLDLAATHPHGSPERTDLLAEAETYAVTSWLRRLVEASSPDLRPTVVS